MRTPWTKISAAKKDGRDYILGSAEGDGWIVIGRWAIWMPEGAAYWQQAGGGECWPTHFMPMHKLPPKVKK